MRRWAWAGLCAVVAACGGERAAEAEAGAAPAVATPAEHATGRLEYERRCAGCHGDLLEGSDFAPSLLDPMYLAPAYTDSAFHAAVVGGVLFPRTQFTKMPMPALPQLDGPIEAAIRGYVRWAQGSGAFTPRPATPP